MTDLQLANSMRRILFKSAYLLAVTLTLGGCAGQSTIDRLEPKIGSASAPNNIVAKGGTRTRPEFTTGGFIAGTRSYSVGSWKTIANARFEGGQVTLLAAEGEPIRLGTVFDASGNQEAWDKILSAHFAVMNDLLGGHMPRVNIKVRLLPAGVRYRWAERQPFSGYDEVSLEILAVIPTSGELDRDWVLTTAISAMHESFHVIRTDPARFPRDIALSEEEVEAYILSSCSSVIANNRVPEALLQFPSSLEDAVDPAERDIAIADIYEQALAQKNEPTVVGLNVAMLAFFRYLSQLKASGGASTEVRELIPFCRGTARDQLHWAERDIDLQVKHLAEEVARRAQR